MNPERIEELLGKVASGTLSPEAATRELATLPYAELGHSTLDTHRELRQGLPETVFGENKTAEQLVEILRHLSEAHGRVLATRVPPETAGTVLAQLPNANYDPTSRLMQLSSAHVVRKPVAGSHGYAVVACAGTSDLPVAEEAAQTLEFIGHRVERLTDVGVAGVHRLFDKLDILRDATVILCIAGMEGALTSVIGGLVACPVIGVPTSIGYGVAKGGHTALHAMLSSCASGVAVVNIDNGFGAAVFAHTILSQLAGHDETSDPS
jgi:NCAIR mutase (PurE)-related protein